ncbi:hypothetical protein CEXT_727111 [Caerostris extrusa]|uniref:Uncharacterized protein n=1 Tax=Caerostris extrusa TaxID=172846 RepID=A0AAV4RHT6_CAEEX|nr:hypothetical protein CEXT_727111 [Caerostris extrusa]
MKIELMSAGCKSFYGIDKLLVSLHFCISAVYDSPRSNEPTDESSNSNQSTSSNVDKSKLIIKIGMLMTKKNSTNNEVNNFLYS